MPLIDFILHIDEHLASLIATYGTATYAILFAIIFAETGLVVAPILPGDSLIFAAGALAATTALDPWILFLLLSVAAIVGDSVNYAIGKTLGPRVFRMKQSRWLNPEHLKRAHAFYDKYGPLTIIVARFIPIVRTFAPFVAGIAHMNYVQFLAYNVAGGLFWVGLFTWIGYFFGNLPFVQHNFELLVLGIIALSVLPPLIEFLRHRFRQASDSGV